MPRPEYRAEKEIVNSIIRVDHAGEYGAIRMYKGQLDAIKNKNNPLHALIKEMLSQEMRHFEYFDNLIDTRKIKPTKYMKYWHHCSYALGFITAKCGGEMMMLCTEAVEDVIDVHYKKQMNVLSILKTEQELLNNIEQFREEELTHKTIAVDFNIANNLKNRIAKKIIGFICRFAIKLSK